MTFEHVYIHFPYCLYKCEYCDFNSYAYKEQEIPEEAYLGHLKAEIRYWQERFPARPEAGIKSVFLGGGTPSLMRPVSVRQVLAALNESWGLSENPEITLESNPGTVTRESFASFKEAGINRISMGVQSFDDANLQRFGRIHTAKQATEAIEAANDVFENVSFDLIYGFPDQSLRSWQSDLETAVRFGVKHLSAYALTAEPHTEYTYKLKQGSYQETDSDTFFEMQSLTYEFLEDAGLPAYEVSNFAAKGSECQHNLAYWQYKSYLGLGAGATANIHVKDKPGHVERWTNWKRPQDYEKAIATGNKPYPSKEVLTPGTTWQEYLMMGLRLKSQFDAQGFQDLYGKDFLNDSQTILQSEQKKGRLILQPNALEITTKGFLENNPLVLAFLD